MSYIFDRMIHKFHIMIIITIFAHLFIAIFAPKVILIRGIMIQIAETNLLILNIQIHLHYKKPKLYKFYLKILVLFKIFFNVICFFFLVC